ncbi:hypothetical protein GQX74_004949, partial [Glossina fuscipes]
RFDKLQRPTYGANNTFQALRIFVNNELNEINYGMVLANDCLHLDVHQEIGWNICFGDQIIWDHMLCCIVDGVLGCAIYDCVMLFQTVEICSEGRIILFNAVQLVRYLVTILPYISSVILADGVGKNGSTVAMSTNVN